MQNGPDPGMGQDIAGQIDARQNANPLLRQDALSTEQPGSQVQEVIVYEQKRGIKDALRLGAIGAILLFVISGSALSLIVRNNQTARLKAGKFGSISMKLAGLARTNNTDSEPNLQVNGTLYANSSIVFAPQSQPNNPLKGQLYYDKSSDKLAYYNGQRFVSLGEPTTAAGAGQTATSTNTTIIDNSATVKLQSTAPGLQQIGSLNISGTAAVGSLNTTVVSSGGNSFYINPLDPNAIASQQAVSGTSATSGLKEIGAISTGSPLNGTLIATKTTLGQYGGTAKSITVYLAGGSATKHVQVGLYDDDGDIPSRPSALLSTSAVTTIVPNSYNTITIPSVSLSANSTYWMAFNTDDNTLVRTSNSLIKGSCFYGLGFGSLPDPFGIGNCFYANEQYTMYINYTVGSTSGGSAAQALLTIDSTGQTVFRNSTDSNTAFQVQNAAGTTTVFNIDTVNGRIAIGKATASYKLDIAAGDINLSNGRSIRFGGLPVLSMNSNGTGTSISNFASGGQVIAQADNFIVQDANGGHQSLAINSSGAAAFSNNTNSTTAFQIQNATGTALLTADTTNSSIHIGSSTGSSTPVLLFLANKNTADDPIGDEGALYYNSTLGSFRCFYSGFWHNCADIEPQHNFSVYDEFLGGQTSFAGIIGSLGWNALAIGANGSLVLNPNTPTPSADRPGTLQLQTPASANQGTTLLLGDSTGGSLIIAKDNDIKVAVAIGSASGHVLRVGLHSETSTTNQPLSGIWWEADPATNSHWRYCYGDGTTATCANTTISITANTWATLEIRVTATGGGTSNAYFIINGTSYQVSTKTIDTTNRVSPALSFYSTNGTAQNCYWDYFQLTGTTGAAR
jgi:hypothetical protein